MKHRSYQLVLVGKMNEENIKEFKDIAKSAGISEKKLNRIYQDPIKILDDYKTLIKLSDLLSYSYPYMIEIFFNESQKSDYKNTTSTTC